MWRQSGSFDPPAGIDGGAAHRRRIVGALTIALVLSGAGCASDATDAPGGAGAPADGSADAASAATGAPTTLANAPSTSVAAAPSSEPTSVPTSAESTSAATTTVAPMSTMEPGDISLTVAPQVQATAAPVGIDDTAEFRHGVTAAITQVVAVETQAELPGEIAGPGVALTVQIVNGSADAIDLEATLVDLVDADGLSATQVVQGTEPHTGMLAAGASMFGTYIFSIDEVLRRDVTVHLSYAADEPIVVFTGNLAGQE